MYIFVYFLAGVKLIKQMLDQQASDFSGKSEMNLLGTKSLSYKVERVIII